MLDTTAGREVRLATSAPDHRGQVEFAGFKPPTSNTTYTPNQFFDVVIPHFSRGVVRIVGYLIRKTLGWCDANGNPQEEQIEVTYRELEQKAGVGHDAIRQALDDALAGRLIECVREGRRRTIDDSGQSALYSLRWSPRPYTRAPSDFHGFFEGDGNRTDIPNEFFDVVIPNEILSVIKVVGSVIRHSIGFQAKHGRRRQQVPLSYQHIQNYARISSRRNLSQALCIAQDKHFIIRVEEGVFSHLYVQQKPAVYALCWADFAITPKKTPEDVRSDLDTSNTPIFAPENHSEKRTSTETKPQNETLNRQPAADTVLHEKLVLIGFSDKTASKLIREHSKQTIEEQLVWLPHRTPAQSPAGLLRRAIEQRWLAPAKLRATEVFATRGFEFARSFYAAYGGNRGEPVNEPSPREAQLAESFVQRLVRATKDDTRVVEWGRALGQRARDQRHPFPSLQLAIRQFGDAFLVAEETKRLHAQLAATTLRREEHEAHYRQSWLAWLAARETAIQHANPTEYARFVEKRAAQKRELGADGKPWSVKVMQNFDTDSARLQAFREFFKLADFWQWDASFNNQSLTTIS